MTNNTQATSGTSGQPKLFELTDDQKRIRADLLAKTKGAGFPKLKSIYAEYDPKSELMQRLERYAASAGVKLFRPTRAAATTNALFAANKIEGIISSPPRLVQLARSKIDHKFRYILSTGAILSPKDCREIRAALLADGGEMYSSYATSEIGSTIALATVEQIESVPGCVGKPMDDVTVEIDSGEVRVKVEAAHGAADRYADKALTDKHFRTVDGVTWFYPGDKARMENGLLVLEGRVQHNEPRA